MGTVDVEQPHRLPAGADLLDRRFRVEPRPDPAQECSGIPAVLPVEDAVLVDELRQDVDVVDGPDDRVASAELMRMTRFRGSVFDGGKAARRYFSVAFRLFVMSCRCAYS